jgi:hypothetical protein
VFEWKYLLFGLTAQRCITRCERGHDLYLGEQHLADPGERAGADHAAGGDLLKERLERRQVLGIALVTIAWR